MPVAWKGPWEGDHKYSERFEEAAFVRELLTYNPRNALDPKTLTHDSPLLKKHKEKKRRANQRTSAALV